MKFNRSISLILVTLLLSSCGGGGGSSSSETLEPVQVSAETILSNLNFPSALAYSPEGVLLFGELFSGTIRRVLDNNSQVVGTVPVLGSGNEGLGGIVFDPKFPELPYIYIYFTNRSGKNTVQRFTVSTNGLSDPTVLISDIPAGGHNGGRLVFGANNEIFISTGDAGNPALSQDSGSLAGKILRIRSDGSIPNGNLSSSSLIYALGFRNPFGLAFDSNSGNLYASENGPDCNDELNFVERGGNYGWRPGQSCNDTGSAYQEPLVTFNPPIAPTSILIASENAPQQLRGNLLMADFNSGTLRRFLINGNQVLAEETILTGQYGPILDLVQSSTGEIVFSTPTQIFRLVVTSPQQ